MSKRIMRLDDACPRRDMENWDRMEEILDKYGVRPLVGVIPDCRDEMMEKYPYDDNFWQRVETWKSKGWCIGLHGSTHVYNTASGGINPVNKRSEFAGEPIEVQREKIEKGVAIFRSHGIEPRVFFAPSHTFDENTLIALKELSNVRIISDTIANEPYKKGDFTYVPIQSGRARELPFKLITYYYHPNQMKDENFAALEDFLKDHAGDFIDFPLEQTKRPYSPLDAFMHVGYFALRWIKVKLRDMKK